MEDQTLGQKIKNFRIRSKMSQLDLELEIGASPGSISRIENGQVNPTKETLIKIIEVLKLNQKEAALLFNIDLYEDYRALVKVSKLLNCSLDLKEVLQHAVDEICYELNLLSGFIALIKGNKLYSYTRTDSPISRLSTKFLPKKFQELNVSLENDKENLMVKTILENKVIIEDNLINFIFPAVNMRIAKLLQNVTNVKASISLPIGEDGKVIGAIYFGRNFESDFCDVKEILKEFTEYIAIAINNARKYEELNIKLGQINK